MDINKAYNYIDNDERVSSSGTIVNVNLQSLLDANYSAVINLLPDDSEHARKNEKEDFEKLGIEYTYIPIDWDAPTQANFEAFEATMLSVKDKKIHIHCAANYRATAFYAIFAHKHYAWSKEKIMEFTASIWTVSDYPIWLKFVNDNLVCELSQRTS